MRHQYRLSRRNALKTSVLATTALPACVETGEVDTTPGTTQDGETLLEAFAGGSPLLVARGDIFEHANVSASGKLVLVGGTPEWI